MCCQKGEGNIKSQLGCEALHSWGGRRPLIQGGLFSAWRAGGLPLEEGGESKRGGAGGSIKRDLPFSRKMIDGGKRKKVFRTMELVTIRKEWRASLAFGLIREGGLRKMEVLGNDMSRKGRCCLAFQKTSLTKSG